MFPVLLVMYVRLARAEERQALATFGGAYRRYMDQVPAFLPRLGRQTATGARDPGKSATKKL